jgi:hypothetical protein
MLKESHVVRPRLTQIIKVSLPLFFLLLAGPAATQGRGTAASSPNELSSRSADSQHSAIPPAHANALPNENVIPPGTILPVRLRTTISSEKSKPGQLIAGRIAQNVPLPNGSTIRAGSKIEGQIIEAIPAGTSSGPKLSIRFDKVYAQGKTIPVTTNLRAIAGFMDVMEAGVPVEAPSEGTPYSWLDTTQIGGDSVYGLGGPVMSAENTSELVGKSVNNGVLSHVSAKEGTKCRGAIDGNNNPQALWVFSSDACGIYGLEHVKISHAGRTDPTGTISLVSDRSKLKIPNGTGMLLRVNGAPATIGPA